MQIAIGLDWIGDSGGSLGPIPTQIGIQRNENREKWSTRAVMCVDCLGVSLLALWVGLESVRQPVVFGTVYSGPSGPHPTQVAPL